MEKTIIKRLKSAVPFIMFMLAFLFERCLLCEIFYPMSIGWWLSTIFFFIFGNIITASGIFIYYLLRNKCTACSTKWSKIKLEEMVVNSSSLRLMNLNVKYNEVLTTYQCNNCSTMSDTVSKRIALVWTDLWKYPSLKALACSRLHLVHKSTV